MVHGVKLPSCLPAVKSLGLSDNFVFRVYSHHLQNVVKLAGWTCNASRVYRRCSVRDLDTAHRRNISRSFCRTAITPSPRSVNSVSTAILHLYVSYSAAACVDITDGFPDEPCSIMYWRRRETNSSRTSGVRLGRAQRARCVSAVCQCIHQLLESDCAMRLHSSRSWMWGLRVGSATSSISADAPLRAKRKMNESSRRVTAAVSITSSSTSDVTCK